MRADGRKRDMYRSIIIETGIIPQASGSCRCKIYKTDVLVGIKCTVGTIDKSYDEEEQEEQDAITIDSGKVSCKVDISPSAHVLDYKQVDQLSIKITEFLNRLLNEKGILDLEKLSILNGNSYWILNVDVLVLDYSGNIYDTIMLAVNGALRNTRMPKCIIEQYGNHFEFDISDEETEIIPGVDNIPLCITLNKIGDRFIVDCSLFEELCCEAKIIVALNQKGNICSMIKDGFGSIEPSLIADLSIAKFIVMSLFKQLNLVLEMEDQRVCLNKPPIGFL